MIRDKIVLAIAILCIAVYPSVQQTCSDLTLEAWTDMEKYDKTAFFTNAGANKLTKIQCNLKCEASCTNNYLIWSKDGDTVFEKYWGGIGETGPAPNYTERVELITDDDNNGVYELLWRKNLRNDLPSGQNFTTWTCSAGVSYCTIKAASINIEYVTYPLLSIYANGKLVEKFEDVRQEDSGSLNCSVLTHPTSKLTLKQRDDIKSTDWSCSPYNAFESICSLSVPDFPLKNGFECVVEYDSPESGKFEVVTPDGCCKEDMYPEDEGLSPGEIAGIVIGVLAAFLIIVGSIYACYTNCPLGAKTH